MTVILLSLKICFYSVRNIHLFLVILEKSFSQVEVENRGTDNFQHFKFVPSDVDKMSDKLLVYNLSSSFHIQTD